MMEWKTTVDPEVLGYIPQFFSDLDPRPAKEQIDEAYAHGGGWRPLEGWQFYPRTEAIHYPGDPPLMPIAGTRLRDEVIYVYPHAWVNIVQPDGSFEIARID